MSLRQNFRSLKLPDLLLGCWDKGVAAERLSVVAAGCPPAANEHTASLGRGVGLQEV